MRVRETEGNCPINLINQKAVLPNLSYAPKYSQTSLKCQRSFSRLWPSSRLTIRTIGQSSAMAAQALLKASNLLGQPPRASIAAKPGDTEGRSTGSDKLFPNQRHSRNRMNPKENLRTRLTNVPAGYTRRIGVTKMIMEYRYYFYFYFRRPKVPV